MAASKNGDETRRTNRKPGTAAKNIKTGTAAKNLKTATATKNENKVTAANKPVSNRVSRRTAAAEKPRVDFSDSVFYTNRELSWLSFDKRVLVEAMRNDIPLLEQGKFLSITASNLDEFFMVRVASLKDMVNAGYRGRDIAGMTAAEQLEKIIPSVHEFVDAQYATHGKLMDRLGGKGVKVILRHEELSQKQMEYVDAFFMEQVYPVLTPMVVDSSRPFPLVRNKSLNLAALMKPKNEGAEINAGARDKKRKNQKKSDLEFAMVQVPGVLDRIVKLPSEDENQDIVNVILLEEIIERNIEKLFLDHDILCIHPFRIMRNADLSIEEDEAEDLLKEIEKQLKRRQWGEVIRLEIEENMDGELLSRIQEELEVHQDSIYKINGPLDLTYLMKLYGLPELEDFREKSHVPEPVKELSADCDIFEEIRKKDILLHHPYQSFEPVVNFIRNASTDPEVLAIKQTLYRVSGNSPIINALAKAAENGKQVTVLVELKARFDEEHNIVWARMLEQAGCHVIYGLVGLKTHCKITLVVRREEGGIRRYVHLGTGNYNDSTAKLYTDLGFFTCKEAYGADATAVFNMLSGYSEPRSWNRLSLAPLWLKKRFLHMIRREKEHAETGHPARIIAKMNSLCDKDVIMALYEAAAAGVEIDLIIRGICCLRTGLKETGNRIRVRSIVGFFLEHARIFYFENDGNPEYYLASADWMPRNLERRVEILFPVEDEKLRERIFHILELQLSDTAQASILKADGTYAKAVRPREKVDAQRLFVKEAANASGRKNKQADNRVFFPETGDMGHKA